MKTQSEYLKYVQKVNNFLEANKVKPGCHAPVDSESEPFFSWVPCDCCLSPLGGNRENYSFATNTGQFTANICSDCVYFLAYGKLDDLTMMEIETNK